MSTCSILLQELAVCFQQQTSVLLRAAPGESIYQAAVTLAAGPEEDSRFLFCFNLQARQDTWPIMQPGHNSRLRMEKTMRRPKYQARSQACTQLGAHR